MSNYPLYNESGLQKNNKSHVLYALANKQMELKQIQEESEAKILKVKADLEAMEQVICLFDGDCDKTIKKLNVKSSKSKPRARNRHFINGECKKLVLSVMRTNTEQLTTSDISLKVQDLKKINNLPRKKYRIRLFKNGELKTLVLKNIKASDFPISNKEIAINIQKAKDFDIDVSNKVSECIRVLLKNRIIKNVSIDKEEHRYIIEE